MLVVKNSSVKTAALLHHRQVREAGGVTDRGKHMVWVGKILFY